MDFHNVLRVFCGLLFSILSIVQAESYQETGLNAHNEYRAIHGVQPLALDDKASEFAERHAQYLADSDTFKHSTDADRGPHGYGENIWANYSGVGHKNNYSMMVNSAVKAWYSEISRYNFKNPGYTNGIGHFSQVVWAESKLLGLGVKSNAAGNKVYVVAEYNPPGNVASAEAFSKNVLKGKSTGSLESKSSQLQWTIKIVSLLPIIFLYQSK